MKVFFFKKEGFNKCHDTTKATIRFSTRNMKWEPILGRYIQQPRGTE